ncbi:MAG TPA: toll/interleukin-1 receptor domain-containing protein [Caulobacterales bacterium]|nr:toll/interleukin-1 receptor domain-containing protein [Caulobacterales bacterium]
MADVFISYASDDRDRVRPLAEALQRRGLKVWWDRALAAGQDYAAVIERELAAAKAVVVVWTAGSISSTFVRDEAGRARDDGRMVPILMDRIELPLGFASFQAEDFTRWNGSGGAPQVQILEETLRAKIDGRDVDGAKIAHKRRRLMARVRIVSLLTVLFLIVGIAAGTRLFLHPPTQAAQPVDVRAQLLLLLEEGKLTPDQAIQLAQILEPQALNGSPAALSPGPSPTEVTTSAPVQAELAASDAAYARAAQATYLDAMAALLQSPDAVVRQAAVEMVDPAKRDAAIQRLWDYAQTHPDARQNIYLACGVVGGASGNPLAPQALESAAQAAPDHPNNWALLAHAYRTAQRDNDADAASLVGAGLAAQQGGDVQGAEQHFAQALPKLSMPATRAFVAGQLGAIAEARQDFTSASARYAEAYRASEQAVADDPGATQVLQTNAQRLVQALDRSGRTRDACAQLQRAQVDHDVEAPDADLVGRCATRFHVQLRPVGQ